MFECMRAVMLTQPKAKAMSVGQVSVPLKISRSLVRVSLSLFLSPSVFYPLLSLLLRNYPTLSACSWLLFIKRRCSYCLVQWYKLKIPILFGIRMRVWVPESFSPCVHALLVFVLIFFIAFSLFPCCMCVCSYVLCVVCGTRLSTLS